MGRWRWSAPGPAARGTGPGAVGWAAPGGAPLPGSAGVGGQGLGEVVRVLRDAAASVARGLAGAALAVAVDRPEADPGQVVARGVGHDRLEVRQRDRLAG